MSDHQRKPFKLDQQSGAQADAVRSKIATLMDGATVREEQRQANKQPSQAADTTLPTPPALPVPPVPVSSVSVAPMVPPTNEVNMAGDPIEPEVGPASIGEPMPGAVTIKGRSGGVLVEIGKGHWADLVVVLQDRLARAGNFFRNGSVALDLGARTLHEQDLRALYRLLAQHELKLGLIRTASSETFQLALSLGLAAHLEQAESKLLTVAQPTLSNLTEEHHFVYSGHLRAGQVLQRREHILVIGDVNPGGTVISDGDVLVWGHLRGVAHAGASGDRRAVIVALDLSPVQLRIQELLAIAPDTQRKGWGPWKRSVIKHPEIAYLANNEIVVEAWDASKFGGIATLRR